MSNTWLCDGCGKEFDKEDEATKHEIECLEFKPKKEKEIGFVLAEEVPEAKSLSRDETVKAQALFEQKRREKEALIEHKRIEEQNKKREQERQIFLKKLISEELNELEDHSYISMESKERFPYHTLYISLIQIVAFLALFFFIILGIVVLDNPIAAFTFFGVGCAVFFFTILSAEVVRFALDFHDSNYINTNVRIKTLKVLEKINENLKK